VLGWLHHFWDERISYEGGLSLLWMDGLLLVPLIMAAFFYPLEALFSAVGLVVLSLVAYEGYILWNKRHRMGG
jgi:hypothetical protein